MPAEPRQLHFKRQLCVRSQGCSVNSEQQLQTSKGELRTVEVLSGNKVLVQDFDPNYSLEN
jgi:hypothetical protein